ncbi:MAG TPA: cytidine deaminase [Acidobacteriaceae bacterium]|nr:cytidine deaminase [Acidobacteriaceae bacterium]
MPPSPITLSLGQQAELLSAARDAAEHAYAPYSGFRVGAALLLQGGEIVTAANVENASYSLSICAERSAVARAVAQHGPKLRIHAVAVTNLNNAPSSPCGACRQVLFEFMPANGLILFPFDGRPHTHTLAELFPFSFDLTHAG